MLREIVEQADLWTVVCFKLQPNLGNCSKRGEKLIGCFQRETRAADPRHLG